MLRSVSAAMLLATSVAAAEPRTTRLDATGVSELASVEERANELLGRNAISTDAAARVDVSTAREGETLSATLTFTDENGVAHPRAMTAASCDELAESVALVISLVLREEAPPPPAPVSPPPSPVEQPTNDALFTPAAPPATSRVVELGVATSSARHSALVLGGRLERRRTTLGAEVAVGIPEQVDAGQGAVYVWSARADIAACLRMQSFAACGLAGGGVVRARGTDLMDASSAVLPQASVGLRAEWHQRLTRRVGLRVFATIDQVLVRPSFLVDATAVWTTPLIQAWLGGGVFFHMP
jgi:hypothetical protein